MLDKRRDHGAVHLFGDVRVGTQLVGQGPDLGEHLLNPLRRLDGMAVFFKTRSLRHIAPALCNKADDLAIQLVNVFADFVQGLAVGSHVV